MYPFVSPALELKRRTASDVIPGWVVGLLAGLQVVLWLAIMILEGVSVYYNSIHGTIYAGFWCSIIFFITWISMFCFLCCGKANCCGIYLIVMNTIALCFSVTLVTFTSIFVNNPCKCYGFHCDDFSWLTCFDRFILQKVPYLKGLLACGALMLLTNLSYIITYIAVSIWLCIRGNADMNKMNAVFQNQLAANVNFGHQQQQQQQYPSYPMNYPPQIAGQQYPPYMINNGYHQPLSTKPMPQQQSSQNDGVGDGQF